MRDELVVFQQVMIPRKDHLGIGLQREVVRSVAARARETGGGPDLERVGGAHCGEGEPKRRAGGGHLIHDQHPLARDLVGSRREDLRALAHIVVAVTLPRDDHRIEIDAQNGRYNGAWKCPSPSDAHDNVGVIVPSDLERECAAEFSEHLPGEVQVLER